MRLRGEGGSAIFHLLGLVEKKRGDFEAASAALANAHAAAPDDPQINNNYANLLADMGQGDAALAHYARALALSPHYVDPYYNSALLLQRLGRLEEALDRLDAALRLSPGDARIHSARGGVLKAMERFDDAAAAYDKAIALAPRHLNALHGRARIAMETGEAGAPLFYQRALMQKPGDPELVLGLAEALEAEGDPLGLDILKEVVAARPDWIEGHEVLARMRMEAGEGDRFASHYTASLKQRPQDRQLHLSFWRVLARAERHAEALRSLRNARIQLVWDEQMLAMEAMLLGDAGDPRAALALLDRLKGSAVEPNFHILVGRMKLAAGDVDEAALRLGQAVAADPAAIDGWAYLDLCWRLLKDGRHHWLSGQPGLIGTRELDLDAEELSRIAGVIAALHRTRAHPIGQSLRGGTQTRGRLFWRGEPEIARLGDAIRAAIEDHVAQLPPDDEKHPLLRHRNAGFDFAGSWSVRLTSQGFHVNHIHPEGILSSACYIRLPESIGSASCDGWLEIGSAPDQIRLDLEPLASIEPVPGRLALFPSYLFHGTRPFSAGERLTVAFDLVPR